jgi:hypothetical protein
MNMPSDAAELAAAEQDDRLVECRFHPRSGTPPPRNPDASPFWLSPWMSHWLFTTSIFVQLAL